MRRVSYAALDSEFKMVKAEADTLKQAFQAAANNEIEWYGKKYLDGTQFRFGVCGLMRADGGHIIIQTRVKQSNNKFDRAYNIVRRLDDAFSEVRAAMQSGAYRNPAEIVQAEYILQAYRMRNEAYQETL